MNITQTSNRSGTSSLFSEENEDKRSCSRSPVKQLYKNEEECKGYNGRSSDSDKDKSNPDSMSSKKNELSKPVIPPPLSLLPKSQIPNEPLRTAAGVPFLKLTLAKGGSNIFIEKQETKEVKERVKESEEIEGHKGKRQFKSMFYTELRGCENNPIVFDRFSKTPYDPDAKLPEELLKP